MLYTIGGVACGLGIVMVQQWRQMGDPLASGRRPEVLAPQARLPVGLVREGLGALKDADPRPVKVLDLVAVGMVVVCVFYAVRLAKSWPYEAWMLPIVVVGVPLCGPYLSSMSRFLLSAWPVFSIGGEILGRAPTRDPLGFGYVAVGYY